MDKPKEQLNLQIAELSQNLVKIYETLGFHFQPQTISSQQSSNWRILLGNFAGHEYSMRVISEASAAIAKLQQLVEDRELDHWNERQTFERQKAKLEEQLVQFQKLKKQNEEKTGQLTAAEAINAGLTNHLQVVEKQHASEKEKQWLGFVREIIQMRDNLSMKEEILKEEVNYTEGKAWKLIQALYRETEAILRRKGVTPIHQDSMFDSDIHMVTDTVPTDQEELHDTVAQTFREGYRTADKIIRLQEVILYSFKKELQ